MPIRPENRDRYPADWPTISHRIRFERAGGRCECRGECGLSHDDEGDAGDRCPCLHGEPNPRTSSRVVLTTAHRHGTEIEDVGDEDLFAACQQCHNRYDAPARHAGRKERARQAVLRTVEVMRFQIECATGKRFARD